MYIQLSHSEHILGVVHLLFAFKIHVTLAFIVYIAFSLICRRSPPAIPSPTHPFARPFRKLIWIAFALFIMPFSSVHYIHIYIYFVQNTHFSAAKIFMRHKFPIAMSLRPLSHPLHHNVSLIPSTNQLVSSEYSHQNLEIKSRTTVKKFINSLCPILK